MSKKRAFIGTSGYSYPHWSGVFYPKDLREAKWLEYYTKYFDTVELNVTFYRLPKESAFLSWYKRTPKYFEIVVKGSRFVTHIKRLKDPKDSLNLFFGRTKFLKEKLGPILWQLPPKFKADPKRLASFIKALKKYKKIKNVFEFRHETWFSKEILKILKNENIALCSADWPEFAKELHYTADFIYIRRHGAGANLYGGCYTKRQLKDDAAIIKKCLKSKKDAYIYFNNDAEGYAVKNALQLKKIV